MHFENNVRRRVEEQKKSRRRRRRETFTEDRSVNGRLECCAQSDIFCIYKETKRDFCVRDKKEESHFVRFYC